MKNDFYFILKALCVVLTFWSCRKMACYEKAKCSFNFYDVIYWKTSNYNTHTAQYFKK